MASSRGGVTTAAISAAEEQVHHRIAPVPDVLAYLQNETELTRSTLVRILKESGRLAEFFVDPQRFMDAVANILKHELHRLLVDGIKYEKIGGGGPDAEWEMLLFKNEELINYLNALAGEPFGLRIRRLRIRGRAGIRQDGWTHERTSSSSSSSPAGSRSTRRSASTTPTGPSSSTTTKRFILVRETKSTKDFLKLRTSEADKVRCGQKHFETLGVPFAVVVSADEV